LCEHSILRPHELDVGGEGDAHDRILRWGFVEPREAKDRIEVGKAVLMLTVQSVVRFSRASTKVEAAETAGDVRA